MPDSTLSSTTSLAHHVSCGYSYTIVGPDGIPSTPVTYRGADATDRFLENLLLEQTILMQKIKTNVPMCLNDMEQADFTSSRTCYVCGNKFTVENTKVRDHDHATGFYRGAACNSCNLKLKSPNFIPVFIHNLSRYDAHLIMEKIGLVKGEAVKCIPTNSENYISFSLGNLRFLDTVRFMPGSLKEHADNLANAGADKFTCMNEFYSVEEVQLLLRKQVYPYEYMDQHSKFTETKLPPKASFYNTLTDEELSDLDYRHAENVWQKFGIQNLGKFFLFFYSQPPSYFIFLIFHITILLLFFRRLSQPLRAIRCSAAR